MNETILKIALVALFLWCSSLSCEIIDVDDKWVLVRYINGKKTKEKLINLSVLEGVKYK